MESRRTRDSIVSKSESLTIFSPESEKPKTSTLSTNQHGDARFADNDIVQSLNLKIENNFREYTVVIVGIEESQHLFNQLSKIVAQNIIQSFNDTKSALTFFRSLHETDIFVIISGTLGHHHAHEFLVVPEIIGVYIYCMGEDKHLKWSERTAKIRCVVSNPEQLFIRLHNDIKQLSSRWPVGEKSFQKAASHAAQWYHLFLLIIGHCSRDIDSSYEEMFDECRAYYKNNTHMLKEIDRFAQSYKPENVIYEYTRDNFVYRILNHALRVQDLKIIRKFSPVIRDLHVQLHKYHHNYCRSGEHTIRCVYRGQHLSKNELEYLRSSSKTRNPILTLTHFGSTSLDPEIALNFSHPIRDHICCLFEIIITDKYFKAQFIKEKPEQAFVDISSQSSKPEEKEVLFSLVTHFRVTYVGHPISYKSYQYVPIILKLTRDVEDKCNLSRYRILTCMEEEDDQQVYTDILNMVQMNAADEQQFGDINWDKWWQKLSRQWGYYRERKQPLDLIFYNSYTKNKFWMRKAVEIYKHKLISRFGNQSTRPSFSELFGKYKRWQAVPARWIALYEDYLEQFCTTGIEEVVECLRFAGETYELIGDRECALACYQKALDFNVDDKLKKNEQISKRMKVLRKSPEQAREMNSKNMPIITDTENNVLSTDEIYVDEWTVHWRLKSGLTVPSIQTIIEALSSYLTGREQWYDTVDAKIILRLPFGDAERLPIDEYRSHFLIAVHTHIIEPKTDAMNNPFLALWRCKRYMDELSQFKQIENLLQPYEERSSSIRFCIFPLLDGLRQKLNVLITLCIIYLCVKQKSGKVSVKKLQTIDMESRKVRPLMFFNPDDSALVARLETIQEHILPQVLNPYETVPDDWNPFSVLAM